GVSNRVARVGWGLVAITMLAGQVGYGWWRLGSLPGRPEKEDKPLRVALIQGSIDTDFGADPTRPQRMMEQYSRLTYEALRKHGPVDLVVWPESMFPLDAVVLDSDAPTLAEGYARADLVASQQQFDRLVRRLVQGIQSTPGPDGRIRGGTWLLLGVVVWHFDERESRRYNSALLFDPTGRLRARYDKMHPVLFGEYVPFGETFPWLYRLTPMSNGLTAGEEPVAFDVEGVRFSVSICFESIVPELIRRQVVELADRGEAPDALINITNDGWFWGSSILDLQLHSAVFRAVENRLPMLVAANTGLSAWILPSGQVVAEGPRHDTGFLLAEVGKLRAARAPSRGNTTAYHRVGDRLWIGAVGLSLVGVLIGAWQCRRGESRGESGES
ncbi:MAG TPA: apolipoprotein N-acyltransferase, partial [Planctomycetaceae bacterium]|nr:apolipoprotein N-acyltransferase [Planctomycetaceae bacterium]